MAEAVYATVENILLYSMVACKFVLWHNGVQVKAFAVLKSGEDFGKFKRGFIGLYFYGSSDFLRFPSV